MDVMVQCVIGVITGEVIIHLRGDFRSGIVAWSRIDCFFFVGFMFFVFEWLSLAGDNFEVLAFIFFFFIAL